MQHEVKKILVLRFSSIGDIVLTSPVVRALKTQTSAEIHFLTKKTFLDLVEPNPNIDKVYVFSKDFNEILDDLKAEKYDYIVDLHNNLRTLRLKKALGLPSKSFPKLNIKKWLYVQFKWDIMPDIHIVDRYFKAVHQLGVTNDNQGLDYFIPQQGKINIETFLPSNFQKSYCAIAIGAQFATKRLTDDQLVTLVQKITGCIVLIGGSTDKKLGDELVKLAPDRIYNSAGSCSLGQSASLVEQASFVISHDTGMMHVASAFKKPILSIWGNTTPQLGMYPYLPVPQSTQFEVTNLSCRPCSKIGYQSCPKKHFDCMTKQDLTAIALTANVLFVK
jgi:ADP-heptose:LPS heptosyltransferase